MVGRLARLRRDDVAFVFDPQGILEAVLENEGHFVGVRHVVLVFPADDYLRDTGLEDGLAELLQRLPFALAYRFLEVLDPLLKGPLLRPAQIKLVLYRG